MSALNFYRNRPCSIKYTEPPLPSHRVNVVINSADRPVTPHIYSIPFPLSFCPATPESLTWHAPLCPRASLSKLLSSHAFLSDIRLSISEDKSVCDARLRIAIQTKCVPYFHFRHFSPNPLLLFLIIHTVAYFRWNVLCFMF